jgi:heme oxygenase
MTTEVSSLATRLREETRDHHERAEKHPFQQELLSGRLDRSAFVASLEQWLCVHRVLEEMLRRHREVPQIRRVLKDYQFHESRLCEDLKHFGRSPEHARPLAATDEFNASVRRAAESDPASLLGFHYVIEGSKNGSKHIARILQRVYALQPGPGLLYQDPYGDAQRENWQAFRADLESAEFTAAQEDAIVEAAKGTFEGIICLMDEIHASCKAA